MISGYRHIYLESYKGECLAPAGFFVRIEVTKKYWCIKSATLNDITCFCFVQLAFFLFYAVFSKWPLLVF